MAKPVEYWIFEKHSVENALFRIVKEVQKPKLDDSLANSALPYTGITGIDFLVKKFKNL